MNDRRKPHRPAGPDPVLPDPPEDEDVRKARLFRWHSARGTMGLFWDLYPEDRPPPEEPKPAPRQHDRSR